MTDSAINLDRVDIVVLKSHCLAFGVPYYGSDEMNVARLASYFEGKANAGKIKLAQCDVCFGQGDAALPQCPFCGDSSPVQGIARVDLLAPTTATELDTETNTIRNLLSRSAEQLYEAGQRLRAIQESKAFRLEKDQYDLPKYRSFFDWVKDRIGLSYQVATRIMNVSEQYTLDEVREFGVSRLCVSLRVPEPVRGKFLDRTRAMPVDAVDAAAKAVASGKVSVEDIEAPHERKPRKKRVSPVASDTNPWPEPEDVQRYTVAKLPLGLREIPLWQRPRRQAAIMAPAAPARYIDDDPWALVDLGGGVTMRFVVIPSDDGTLRLVMEVQGKPEVDGGVSDGTN